MYSSSVRRQIVARLRSGEPVAVVAAETGVCQATLLRWKRQALIDAGVIDCIPKWRPRSSPQHTSASLRKHVPHVFVVGAAVDDGQDFIRVGHASESSNPSGTLSGAPADFLFTHHGKQLSQNAVRQELTPLGPGSRPGTHHTVSTPPHQCHRPDQRRSITAQALIALLGHVSSQMSLRYAHLFDHTVRTEYERALNLAKSHIGGLPTTAPQLPIADVAQHPQMGHHHRVGRRHGDANNRV
jgi:hypothetical protein